MARRSRSVEPLKFYNVTGYDSDTSYTDLDEEEISECSWNQSITRVGENIDSKTINEGALQNHVITGVGENTNNNENDDDDSTYNPSEQVL